MVAIMSQSRGPRRDRAPRRKNREAELTKAAADVFWQKGYRAASIQDVADRVGVLKGSLYHYIDSKEDLLFWIIGGLHEEWEEILRLARELDATPIVRIHAFIRLHVEWYLSNVKEVSVLFNDWQNLSGERLRTMRERRRLYERVITEMIEAAQEAGEVPATLNQRYAAKYLLAAMNAVPDWYSPSYDEPPAGIAQHYANLTVAMLGGKLSS
jgi:AcrR family transcriptional regulator